MRTNRKWLLTSWSTSGASLTLYLTKTTLRVVHNVSEAPEVGHNVRNVSDVQKVVHDISNHFLVIVAMW